MTRSRLQRAGVGLMAAGALFISFVSAGPVGWALIGLGGVLAFAGGARPLRTPVDWSVGLLLVMAGVTLLVTASLPVTHEQVSRLLAGFIAFYAVVLWARSDKSVAQVAGLLVGLGVTLAAASLVAVDWLAPQAKLLPERLLMLFPTVAEDTVHPNVMASTLLIVLPLALAWGWSSRRESRRRGWILAVATVVMALVFVLTQSRGGLIGLAVSTVVIVGALAGWRWGAALALVSSGAVAMLLIVGGSLSAQAVQGSVDTSTLAFRLAVWRIAVWMSSEFAFTGVGMGTFNETALRLYPFSETANPGTHNWYLQVAVDLGLPGLVAFLALVMAVVWMGVASFGRINPSTEPSRFGRSVGAVAALLGLLVHGLVDNTVWGTRAAVLPWLLMGLITATFLLITAESATPVQPDADSGARGRDYSAEKAS